MMLIVVRHGAQDFDGGGLTPEGQGQVRGLAERLASHLPSGDIFLAYSEVARTRETADILAARLQPKKTMPLSWLQDGELAGRRARTLADDSGAFAVAILVTHLPVANEILGAFAKDFGLDDPPKGPVLAEAILVDVPNKNFVRI